MSVKSFWKSKSGNFAMMFSIAIIPLILGAGVGLDYSRMLRAKSHLQDVADAASLSLAAARLDDDARIAQQAQDFVDGNYNAAVLDAVKVEKAEHHGDSYEVALSGTVPALFMSIANVHDLGIGVSSTAVRGVTGSVEVALVLDNTTSMGETDSSGTEKIVALRAAASDLSATLHADPDASVKIAVVPYANYVNVGLANRNQSWVSVGTDEMTTSNPPDDCGIPRQAKRRDCLSWREVPYTYDRDGKVVHGTRKECTAYGEWYFVEVPGPSCEVKTSWKRWYGCVTSRVDASLRATDASPAVPYPGILEGTRHCPAPILPLTDSADAAKAAIDSMTDDNGYMANTYIPAGLMWGLNVLSPRAPFTQPKDYDPNNKDPRKVVVLMTDGENTMRVKSNGTHDAMSVANQDGERTEYNADQVAETREDTLALCNTIKGNKIEIFSVAFAVESAESRSLLQECASDSEHYFDATDSAALKLAFSQIADALAQVRLAR